MLKFLFGIIAFFFSINSFSQDNFENKGSSKQKLYRQENFGLAENYDLKYHRIKWFVDPDTFYIEGSVTSFFVSKDDSLKSLYFELSRLLFVDSVIYRGTKISFKHTSVATLEIILPVMIPQGMLDSVTICYHGRPENSSGSFVKDFHDTASVIWTLSEPYGSIDWWPCKHSLNDKVDSLDIYVKTTKGNLVASNGLLISENLTGAFYTCHWKHTYPITAYLVAIGVTNYARVSDKVEHKGDTFDILNYVYPEFLNLYRNDLAHTVDIMKFFIDIIGSYPFKNEKYGHAQFGRNGGMEHQTMSFMGHFRENLVAHELAHQWFGDKITCQSWADIWLNESFATFLDGLTEQRFQTEASYTSLLKNRINSITSKDGGSIYIFGADTLNDARVFSYRLSYQKGAMVLNTLRFMLGDSLLFLAIRNYLEDPKLAYSFSTTADFQYHLEKVSGLKLEDFFNDWIYGQGFPSYTINFYPIKNHITVIVSQKQSDISVKYFELPLPIRFAGVKDTLVILNHTHDNQVFEFDLSFAPDSFYFNSAYQIISKNNKLIINDLNIDKEQAVVLFPNPVQNNMNLMFLGESELKTVTFLTTLGQQLSEYKYENRTTIPGERISYDISLFNPGTYLVRVELNSGVSFEKFVKFD